MLPLTGEVGGSYCKLPGQHLCTCVGGGHKRAAELIIQAARRQCTSVFSPAVVTFIAVRGFPVPASVIGRSLGGQSSAESSKEATTFAEGIRTLTRQFSGAPKS